MKIDKSDTEWGGDRRSDDADSKDNKLISMKMEKALIERLDGLKDEVGIKSRSELIRRFVIAGIQCYEKGQLKVA